MDIRTEGVRVSHFQGSGFAGAAVVDGGTAQNPLLTTPQQTPARRAIGWLLEGTGAGLLRPVLDGAFLALATLLTVPAAAGAGVAGTLVLFPPLVVALLAGRGLYRRRLARSALDDLRGVASGVSLGVMLLVVVQLFLAGSSLQPRDLAELWAVGVVLTTLVRIATLAGERVARRRGLVGRRTLIVGAGAVGERIARRLLEHPEYGLVPIGFLDAEPPDNADRVLPVVGGPADLDWIAQLGDVQHVVIAFSATSDSAFVPVVRRCEELGLGIAMVPRLFDALNDRTSYEALGGLPVLGLDVTDPRGLPFQLKHLLDRVLAGVALVVLAPLMLLLVVLVKRSSPGPVLFRQRRVGRDGRPFDLLKFRSMEMPAGSDAAGFVPRNGSAPGGVEGDDRRTRLGRFLRRSSLDELPQLINVVRGEMSLVGPRPERPEYVERFRHDVERYGERHRVKAGITGWAQVHGLRGQTSIADRAEWDNYYIEHWSLWLDIKILLLTAATLLHPSE